MINNKLLKLALRIIVSFLVLILIFRQIETKALVEAFRQFNWPFIWLTWTAAFIGMVIRSFKMKYILKKQDCHTQTATIFGISALNCFYILFMPSLLTTTIKWYMLKNNTSKGTNVFSAMVYNQYTELLIKLIVGLMAIIIFNPSTILLPGQERNYYFPLLAGIALAFVVLITMLLMNKRFWQAGMIPAKKILMTLPMRLQKKGELTIEQLGTFRDAGLTFHAVTALFSITGSVIITAGIYYSAGKAANVEIPLSLIVWMSALIYVLGRIPISVANLGVREFTIVSLLALYGIAEPDAFLMSMIIFSTIVVMAFIGVFYQIFWPFDSSGIPERKVTPR